MYTSLIFKAAKLGRSLLGPAFCCCCCCPDIYRIIVRFVIIGLLWPLIYIIGVIKFNGDSRFSANSQQTLSRFSLDFHQILIRLSSDSVKIKTLPFFAMLFRLLVFFSLNFFCVFVRSSLATKNDENLQMDFSPDRTCEFKKSLVKQIGPSVCYFKRVFLAMQFVSWSQHLSNGGRIKRRN